MFGVSFFKEWALRYRDKGLRPIPCEPRGKRSLIAWKPYQERQPTVEEIEAWSRQWPDANIALVLGNGIFAVDIDSLEGRDNLERAGVKLPQDAPIVATSKGAHIYMAGNAGDRVGLVPGVDIRGVGYVVAPPSIHPSGRAYVWVNDFTGKVPAAPGALLALLQDPTKGQAAPAASVDWFTEAFAGVAEGGRNAACVRLAGFFLGLGVSPDRTLTVLQAWADRCTPPYPHDEVATTVESIAKRESFDAPGSLPPSAADLIEPTLALIANPAANVISTGWPVLDAKLDGGWERGTFNLVAGQAGTGKTLSMLQSGIAAACAGVGVLFVSLEMSGPRLLRRVLSQMSQVKFADIKHGNLVDAQRVLLDGAVARLRGLPFWIETRVRTVEAIDAVLSEFEPGQIGLIFADYTQKFTSPNAGEERRGVVEHVSEMFTKLAVGRNVPVVAASALSRPDRPTPTWRPTINNLRESAKLGYDADTVLLLHRDPGSPALEIDVAKQRDGETGRTILFLHAETLTLRESA